MIRPGDSFIANWGLGFLRLINILLTTIPQFRPVKQQTISVNYSDKFLLILPKISFYWSFVAANLSLDADFARKN
jgi:hypothetical protein